MLAAIVPQDPCAAPSITCFVEAVTAQAVGFDVIAPLLLGLEDFPIIEFLNHSASLRSLVTEPSVELAAGVICQILYFVKRFGKGYHGICKNAIVIDDVGNGMSIQNISNCCNLHKNILLDFWCQEGYNIKAP